MSQQEKTWTRQAILDAIDAMQWDYEAQDNYTEVHREDLIMSRSELSDSAMSNRVVRAVFPGSDAEVQRRIDEVYSFFGKKCFDWWVGPNEQPHDLAERLTARGMYLHDEYAGLACLLNQDLEVGTATTEENEFRVCEVMTEADARAHVAVSAIVWGIDEAAQTAGVENRLRYLALPERRGGYVVAYHGDKPVGNAGYRFSADGRVLYMNGSAVLPEYRKRGIYNQLLRHRFDLARARGAELAVVQARVSTSAPILRKLGFKEHCTYRLFIRE